MRDPGTVIRFLLDRGILGHGAVLAGDVAVEGVTRRNQNLRVSVAGGPGWFVKQPDEVTAHGQQTLRAEGGFYGRYGSPSSPIAAILPRLVAYEPAAPLLVLEFLAGHRTLREHCAGYEAAAFPVHLWRELGRCLGGVHKNLAWAGPEARPVLPWVFQFHKPNPGLLGTISQAGLKVLGIIQDAEAFGTGLDRLADTWTCDTVIHGDIRADNVLVGTDLRLIDWEMCRPGDAAWDVAGCLEIALAQMVDPGLPPVVFQAASRALWRGYTAARGLDPERVPAAAAKAASFTAARVLQSAVELTARQPELPEPVVVLLQICANILADPPRAAAEFFAIT